MPTTDENAATLSGAQFPAVQANTLAALIGSAPQGSMGASEGILASEWDNGAIVFGTTTSEQRIANAAAATAWLEYCADNNKVALLDGLIHIETSTGIDLRDEIFALRGVTGYQNPPGSGFRQFTDNAPIFRAGETTANTVFTKFHIENVSFMYNTQQTISQTSASAILLGQSYFYSTLRASAAIRAYNGLRCTNNFFSNLIDSLFVSTFRGWGAVFDSAGTGSTVNGLHIVGDTSSPPSVHGGLLLRFAASNWVFNQLNVEWFKPDNAGIQLEVCRNCVFNGVNIEQIEPISNVPLWMNYVGNFGVVINGLKVQHPIFSSANSTTVGKLFGNDTSARDQHIVVNGIHIQETEKVGSTFSLIHRATVAGTPAADKYYINGLNMFSSDNPDLDDIDDNYHAPLGGSSVVAVLNDNLYIHGSGNTATGDADATLGMYALGNYWKQVTALTAIRKWTLSRKLHATIFYNLPVGAQFKVVRTATSGGAFPLQIANHDGTVICELATATWATFVMNASHNWILDTYGTIPQMPTFPLQGNLAISTTAPTVA